MVDCLLKNKVINKILLSKTQLKHELICLQIQAFVILVITHGMTGCKTVVTIATIITVVNMSEHLESGKRLTFDNFVLFICQN